jgi:hypothetical protein
MLNQHHAETLSGSSSLQFFDRQKQVNKYSKLHKESKVRKWKKGENEVNLDAKYMFKEKSYENNERIKACDQIPPINTTYVSKNVLSF